MFFVFLILFMMFSLQKLSKGPDVGADVDKQGTDVAPLSVPELLESLVRQSEPLLDHLGVKKGMCSSFFHEPVVLNCFLHTWFYTFS